MSDTKSPKGAQTSVVIAAPEPRTVYADRVDVGAWFIPIAEQNLAICVRKHESGEITGFFPACSKLIDLGPRAWVHLVQRVRIAVDL